MAHTPEQMRDHKKVLESRFLKIAQKEMDELLMTQDEQKDLARRVVNAAEKLIKTPDKTQLTIAFNKQAQREIETLQKIVESVKDQLPERPAKKPPSATAKTPAAPAGVR